MKTIEIIDKGVIEYKQAWDLQKEYLNTILENRKKNIDSSFLLYCEHPHVYTLGRNGVENNLLISNEYLKSIGATYFKTDRGGDITYHGYGQVVAYPIIDLNYFNIGIRQYIHALEETVIRTLAEYDIIGTRIDSSTGVWINTPTGEKKICAIGVKVSSFITMHGFALNVNTDLSYFSHINPCGFTEKGVTSMEDQLGKKIDMVEVKEKLTKHFQDVIL